MQTSNIKDNEKRKGISNVLMMNELNKVMNIANLRKTGKKANRANSRMAWDSRVTAPYIKLDLVIECRRLPKKDSFSQADAFCGLWEVPPGYSQDKRVGRLPAKQEKEVGRTEVVRENKNPRFSTTFRLEYKFQEEQTYCIRVYDEDLRYATDLKEHDFVGGFVFTLGELMGSGGCTLARPLSRGKAYVVLVGQEIIETREVLEFRFSGQDLGLLENKYMKKMNDMKRVALVKETLDVLGNVNDVVQKVNLAKTVLDQFNPFFRLEKLNPEDQSWKVVWKSEVIKDDQNPTWNVARLPLQLLCNDDPENPLKITIWVWNRFAPEEIVGFVETTVSELVMKGKRGIPVFKVMKECRKILGGTKLKQAGSLKVLKSGVVHIPSMLQYFAGGCGMDLMVAIDCTDTNLDWRDDKSLHFRSKTWMNDYQAAIRKIGTIYEAYEGKRAFTMWGYGAKVDGTYQPMFTIGDDLKGMDDLLKAYDDTFSMDNTRLELTPKAELKQIVRSAMFRSINNNRRGQCYSTLVILSTGTISDLQQTADTVCAAAEDAPLSIVIIGVGAKGDFDRLQRLAGGDFGKLRHSNGVPIARDIVNFVKFREFHGNAGRCVSESLKEVPEQFVQHFMNSGIQPNPMKEIPDISSDMTVSGKSRSSGRRSEKSKSSSSSSSKSRGQ